MEPAVDQSRWSIDIPDLDYTWYRVLSYYFGFGTDRQDFAAYADRMLGRFVVERDTSEEPNPPTPGIPVRYSLLDLGEDTEHRYRLYHGESIMAAGDEPGYVFDQLFWHVNAECARHTGDFLLIHAGALATPNGAGVLIPGESGAGKSTLTAGLYAAGFTYYTDEAAAIDPVGRKLYPYPKAITLKDDVVFKSFPHLRPEQEFHADRWYVVPEAPDPLEPCDVGYVILANYEPGAPATVERVSRGTAAYALGGSIINIGRYTSRSLPLLAHVVSRATCLRITGGNLADNVDAIVSAVT